MHAFLITGSEKEERQTRARALLTEREAEEVIELPAPKTKHFIKTIRELNHKLSLKSSDATKPRGVILEDAHLLTTEAANSFLKTLEEPPGNTIIILTAPNEDLVLPTIVSRCQTIEMGNGEREMGEEEKIKAGETLQKLLGAGVGERLQFVEGVGTRQQALEFCAGQIYAARKILLEAANSAKPKDREYADIYGRISLPQLTVLIERLNQTRRDLENNVNVKLTLGDLLLNYPSIL